MKDFALYIAVFILLLALFCMVALTSSGPDKFADPQVSHLSDNPNVSMPRSAPVACTRNNRLSQNAENPESKPESASFAAGISPPSNDPGKAKPKARFADGQTDYLGEDEDSADLKDDFVYTDDIVE